jgi:hypothetical protein
MQEFVVDQVLAGVEAPAGRRTAAAGGRPQPMMVADHRHAVCVRDLVNLVGEEGAGVWCVGAAGWLSKHAPMGKFERLSERQHFANGVPDDFARRALERFNNGAASACHQVGLQQPLRK